MTGCRSPSYWFLGWVSAFGFYEFQKVLLTVVLRAYQFFVFMSLHGLHGSIEGF